MRLAWRDLGTPRADKADNKTVEITGGPATAMPLQAADYFLLTAEPNCCAGCLPGNPLTTVEVFADADIELGNGALRLRGTWHVLRNDSLGWRYQLRGARRIGGVTRRNLLAASSLVCLPMPAPAQVTGVTVDIHSHAGNLLYVNSEGGNYRFAPVTQPMRQGGMAVICLAAVADQPTSRVIEGRIRPFRDPQPGELYAHIQKGFARLHKLVREQGLNIIRDSAGLRAARSDQPSVIVSVEGGDFLEGKPERVDEAHQRWQLRHLQLTHYRPNELG